MDFKINKVTVVKTGTDYTPDELGTKTIKEAVVTLEVFHNGESAGLVTTEGWVTDGDVTYYQPDDVAVQLGKAEAKHVERAVKGSKTLDEAPVDKLPEN